MRRKRNPFVRTKFGPVSFPLETGNILREKRKWRPQFHYSQSNSETFPVKGYWQINQAIYISITEIRICGNNGVRRQFRPAFSEISSLIDEICGVFPSPAGAFPGTDAVMNSSTARIKFSRYGTARPAALSPAPAAFQRHADD